MKDDILRQQNMLRDINADLESIKSFLIGNEDCKETDIREENCFIDTVKINNMIIETIRMNLDKIKNAILGGKN